MASYIPYETYKPTSDIWDGISPAHWEELPNKTFLKIKKNIVGGRSADLQLLSLTLNGVICRDRDSGEGKFPESFDGYQEVDIGDLIFCLFDVDETPRTIGLSDYCGMITSAYTVMKPTDLANSKFLYYYYLHHDFQKSLKPFYSGLRKVVQKDLFKSVKIPMPPIEEQNKIAVFLDTETRKVSDLITKQERLIELLIEKRDADSLDYLRSIGEAAGKAKDSNIPNLGLVDSEWTVTHIKRLARTISKGTTPTTLGAEFTDSGVRFLKGENITFGKVEPSPEFWISENTHILMSRSALNAGDILVVIAGTVGKSAVLSQSLLPANTSQAIAFIRPFDTEVSEWINFWLSLSITKELMSLGTVKTAQPNISMENLGNIPIALPPIRSISEILSVIDQRNKKIDLLIERSVTSIKLLKERYESLISSAVTGKIDVRELA